MSFWDFDDEGPGTFEWDYVLGDNTTGLFPDEAHYVLEGEELTEVIFSHAGGGTMKPSAYGDTYTVENVSPVQKTLFGNAYITFEQGGSTYKATLNKKFKQREGRYVVDLEQW